MQRKWRRDWERSRSHYKDGSAKKHNPLKTLAKGFLPSMAAAGIMLSSMGITYALPTNVVVTKGTATVNQTSDTMNVNQTTNNLIINSDTFLIGVNETLNLYQPSAGASALWKITGNDAASIYGHVNANGRLFLVNANGILFAPGAEVNVGGIVATTLNISDSDFLAGNDTFTGDGGTVVNQGTITAANGGYVTLLGSQVTNDGIIVAQQGTVALAAGNAVTLDLDGDGLLGLAVDQAAVDASVANHQLIRANGGTVIMTAKTAGELAGTVLNNTGLIEAQSIGTVNGLICLDGGIAGTVINSGTLDASGKNAGETGGTVAVLGNSVTLAEGIQVDVSGDASSGGTLTVKAVNDINVNAAVNTGNGNVVLRADSDADSTGTVNFGANGQVVTDGTVSIYYNPVSYDDSATQSIAYLDWSTWQTAYSNPYQSKVTGNLMAYMLVNNANDLQNINNNLSGVYAMGKDIDANATTTWNGGAGFRPLAEWDTFQGVFDGDGHVISGLYINTSDPYAALFGNVMFATIRNVGLENVNITATGSWGSIGSLAGYTEGSDFTNCYATGQITYTGMGSPSIGGLISNGDGYGFHEISNSHSAVTITANNAAGGYFGGLVGNANNFVIANSYSTGTVNVTASNPDQWTTVGGLIGYNSYSTISNGYSTGAVTFTGTGGNTFVGGLVGDNSGGIIENSYTTSPVTKNGGNSSVGGFAGQSTGSIANSYSIGPIIISDTGNTVGGFTGKRTSPWGSGNFTSCYWDTQTSGITDTTKGVGDTPSVSGVTGLATVDMMNKTYLTGLGWDFDNTWYMIDGHTRPFLQSEHSTAITNAHQLQLMAMDTTASYILGSNLDLSGLLSDASGMWNTSYGFVPVGSAGSPFTGSLDGKGYSISGLYSNSAADYAGLFGYISGARISDLGLTNLSVTGSGEYVGGLIGYSDGGTISKVYTTGTVSGTAADSSVGGLVGGNAGTVAQSYSMAGVGGGTAGGLAGYNVVGGLITDSYFDVVGTVSGTSYTGGIAGNNAGTITTSYSAGALSDGAVGGIAGANSGTITAAVWDTTTSGTTITSAVYDDFGTSTDVQGLSTAEMGDSANYLGGWDFTGIWSLTGARPYLKWELAGSTIINSIADLQAISGNLSGVYILGSSLDLSGIDWTSSIIGISSSNAFAGVFKGNGHTISGLTIDTPTATNVGLFGYTSGATISALNLTGVSITAGGAGSYVGSLVGYSGAGTSILGCTSSGTVTASGAGSTVCGLVGYNAGIIDSSTNAATVTASGVNSIAGGLIGENIGGTINSSYNTGMVTGNGDGNYVGGLVGTNASGNITRSYNTGAVTGNGDGNYVGGLVGENISGNITSFYNTGEVTSNGEASYVGGLVGKIASGNITSSYNTGEVIGNGDGSYVGGLAGETAGGNIAGSYNTGVITGDGDGSYVGGLAGRNNAAVTGAYNIAKVTVGGANSYAGGLAGENTAAVTGSYSIGKVTAGGTGSYAGGLAGANTATGTITGSFSATSVTNSGGSSYTGGLVGYNAGGLDNSYSMMKTSAGGADSYAGGLAGYNTATGAISDSFSVGSVTAGGTSSTAGGLAGYNAGGINGAFWCMNTSGMTAGIGSDAVTTSDVQGLAWSDMLTSSRFSNWDTGKWGLMNGFLPYLKWQYSSTPSQVYTGRVEGGSGEIVNVNAYTDQYSAKVIAQGYEFGADGFYYGVNGTGLVPIINGNDPQTVLLTVTNNSDYKANSIYRVTGSGLTGGDLVKDTLIVHGGDKTLTVGQLNLIIGVPAEDILYSYGTINGTPSLIVNGNLIGNNLSTVINTDDWSYEYMSWYSVYATGNINMHTPGDFYLNNETHWGSQQIIAGGDISIIADRDIIILPRTNILPVISAGGNITMVAGEGFVNRNGSAALSYGGRWLVYLPDKLIYSSDPKLWFCGNGYEKQTISTYSILSDELAIDGTGGLTGDFTLWGAAYGDPIPATGSGFIFSEARPTSRPLTPSQILRKTAIGAAHAEDVQNWGSPIPPVRVTDLDEATPPLVNIVNGGVRMQNGDN